MSATLRPNGLLIAKISHWFVILLVAGCVRPAPLAPNRGLVVPHARFGQASFADTGSSAILAAALKYPVRRAEIAAPVSLTASDGTGLSLVAFEARAVIEEPLAFTELRMTFQNPEDRVLEGRFAVTLPNGAAISRLAMRNERGWQEAEVVERQRARQVYEDFLHQKQDPALLEKEAGNEYRARVFPIPARGQKEIIVSYSHELTNSKAAYHLPLKGLPRVQRLRVSALTAGPKAAGYRRTGLDQAGVVPQADFTVPLEANPSGLQSGELIAMRIKPAFSAQPEKIDAMTVLFDTSASRALGFSDEVARLARLIEELEKRHGPRMRLVLATFDQSVTPVFDGPVSEFGSRQLEAVLARRPLGASNLENALGWIARSGPRRAVIVSDAIPTAGRTEPAALGSLASRLFSSIDRLDFVLAPGIHDVELAGRLARSGSKQAGAILAGEIGENELARRLSLPTSSRIPVAVRGAKWTWPETLDSLQPGDEAIVYAVLNEAPKSGPRSAVVSLAAPLQQTFEVPLRTAPRPLLARAVAGAEIARLGARRDQLDAKNASESQRLREEIIHVSTRHRVLSDFTALLVLETEQDYERYGIDRRALVDILSVGDSGIEVLQNRELAVAAATPRRSAEIPDIAKSRPAPEKPASEPPGATDRKPEAVRAPEAMRPPLPAESGKKEEKAYGYEFSDDPMAESDLDGDSAIRAERPAPRAPAAVAPAGAAQPAPMEAAEESPPEPSVRQALMRDGPPALSGPFAEIARLIRAGESERAVVTALDWRTREPGDVMALAALGEALEAHGNLALAARAYGSIIDLFPARADLRRFAGERLDRLGTWDGGLAVDSYTKAVEQRPDHLSGYRLLALALARLQRYDTAFSTLETGLKHPFPPNRFAGGREILLEDVGLIAAAWLARDPARRGEIERRLHAAGATLATAPSLRFILYWETDANDVDFHVEDGRGGDAYYGNPALASGGRLFADVTTGYGPELFAIPGKASAFPYRLGIHYYSRGPMGYGMGKVEIIEHDGRGGLRFADLPFVVMNDDAFVDLGELRGPLFAGKRPVRGRR